MIQYKTTAIPSVPKTGVKNKEFKKGLSLQTCNEAVAPIGEAITNEAKGGWALHSISCIPVNVKRKKTIRELLLGWIPILGNWLFPTMQKQCKEGVEQEFYVLVFVREA